MIDTAAAAAAADSLDALITITCPPPCGKVSPYREWIATPVFGDLPRDEFQCPRCGFAYRRQPRPDRKPWETAMECFPISPRL